MLKSLGETFGIATCTVSDMIKKRAMYKSEYEKNATVKQRCNRQQPTMNEFIKME